MTRRGVIKTQRVSVKVFLFWSIFRQYYSMLECFGLAGLPWSLIPFMYWACIFSLSLRFTLRSISMRQLQKERSWLRHGSDGLHVQSKHQAAPEQQKANSKSKKTKATSNTHKKNIRAPGLRLQLYLRKAGRKLIACPPVTAIGTLGPQHELGKRYLSNCNICLITNINRHDDDIYYWPSRRTRRECSCIHAGPWCLHSSSWLWLLTSCDIWYVDMMSMKTAPCVWRSLDSASRRRCRGMNTSCVNVGFLLSFRLF